jgi:hypothetical protein
MQTNYEKYLSSEFKETKASGYHINKYGILRGPRGIIKPQINCVSYNLKINNKNFYISSKKEVERLFGDNKEILNVKLVTAIWSYLNNVTIKEESNNDDKLFFHKCKTCDKTISRSQTWCDECKEKRKKVNAYFGSRINPTYNTFLRS